MVLPIALSIIGWPPSYLLLVLMTSVSDSRPPYSIYSSDSQTRPGAPCRSSGPSEHSQAPKAVEVYRETLTSLWTALPIVYSHGGRIEFTSTSSVGESYLGGYQANPSQVGHLRHRSSGVREREVLFSTRRKIRYWISVFGESVDASGQEFGWCFIREHGSLSWNVHLELYANWVYHVSSLKLFNSMYMFIEIL